MRGKHLAGPTTAATLQKEDVMEKVVKYDLTDEEVHEIHCWANIPAEELEAEIEAAFDALI